MHDRIAVYKRSFSRRHQFTLIAILGTAAALRLYGLNQQPWIDEVAVLLHNLPRSIPSMATTWPGSSHVFYEMCAKVSMTLFGHDMWSVRLPAAVFGILGVWAIHNVTARMFGSREALTSAALLAVSYHHIFYSQNARGYSMLIVFGLVTASLAVSFWEEGFVSLRSGLAYLAVGALAAYTNLVGPLIIPAQAVVLCSAFFLARRSGRTVPFPLRRYLGFALGSVAVATVLLLPLLSGILTYTRANAANPAEGPRLGIGLVVEILEGLRAAAGGLPALMFGLALGTVGLGIWVRRHPLGLALLAAPVTTQAIVLTALGVGIHPRYLVGALPIVLITAALGLLYITDQLARLLPSTGRPAAAGGAVIAAALATALPLRTYYRYPKQDFLGAIAALRSLRGPTDVTVGVGVAGHVLTEYYHQPYLVAEDTSDLLAAEGLGKRILVVTTLERLLSVSDTAMYRHLRSSYRPIRILPGSLGDGTIHIYEGPIDR